MPLHISGVGVGVGIRVVGWKSLIIFNNWGMRGKGTIIGDSKYAKIYFTVIFVFISYFNKLRTKRSVTLLDVLNHDIWLIS